ncbi:MAG: type II toxin-antitoxin system PemK/MazF family toxin [Gemmatimonadota bacterium]
MPFQPSRGEIWWADLDPARGREQAGDRPCLVVSVDPFNHGPADLVIVVPITSRYRRIPTHVEVDPPEGGLSAKSFIKCENVRSISKNRLRRQAGAVGAITLAAVEGRLRILLDL